MTSPERSPLVDAKPMAAAQGRLPSVEETLVHPSYPGVIWALDPHRRGKLLVSADRGRPLHIAWEVHGSGPTKLVLIMGLASIKSSWQRQTLYFGHERADRFSVLILDNRGVGESDKPFARYSTTQMAADVIQVVDHIGWTGDRELNVVGISLGGMIAQELACAVPQRIQSLSLLSTSASIRSGQSLLQAAIERYPMIMPKSEEQSIAEMAPQVFSLDWLAAPDDASLPSASSTPRCRPPPNGGEYGLFESNFQRFQAQDLAKRRLGGHFTLGGFLCQFIASGWHHKSPQQLRAMADAVGRERIMVMHGTEDRMIAIEHGEALIDIIKPAHVERVEDMGHVAPVERCTWFNALLEEKLAAWAKL